MTSDLSCSPLHVQDGQTALYIASWKGYDQIVELLLKSKADVNHQTKVRLLMLVVCVLLHEEYFFQCQETCITMNNCCQSCAWQQIRLQTPGHNLDSSKLVSALGQVCAQDNWTGVVCKIDICSLTEVPIPLFGRLVRCYSWDG